MRLDRLAQKSKDARTVPGTRGDRRPNPLAPAAATCASRALRHFAIENNEPNRLFGQIVRGGDAGHGDESDVFATVLAETVGQVSCFFGWRYSPHRQTRPRCSTTSTGLASVSANLRWVAASSVSSSANCCSSVLTRASSSRHRGHSVVLDGAFMTPPTKRAATKSTKISFLPVNGYCSRLSVASEVMPSRPETQARPQEVLGLRVFKEWPLPVAEMSLATVSARRRRSDRFPGPNRLS